MDLFCPHCTKRVTVPDEKAGQVTSCPLCSKQFMAPALAPAPVAPAPPLPPPPSSLPQPETYAAGPAPVTAPTAAAPTSAPAAPEPVIELPPPPPPPPPGEYTKVIRICLQPSWLAFLPLICLVVIFVLTFFGWHVAVAENVTSKSLWSLSFSDIQWQFLAYTILMLFPIFPLVVVALVLDLGFAPPPLAPFLPWKSLAVGLLLGLAFLFLVYDYVHCHLIQSYNPMLIPEKLALRLHLLAMMATFGMFWLHWRKRRNLPPPKAEMHW